MDMPEPAVAQTGVQGVLLAAVSITAKEWEQPEYPSIRSQTNKLGLRFNQEHEQAG